MKAQLLQLLRIHIIGGTLQLLRIHIIGGTLQFACNAAEVQQFRKWQAQLKQQGRQQREAELEEQQQQRDQPPHSKAAAASASRRGSSRSSSTAAAAATPCDMDGDGLSVGDTVNVVLRSNNSSRGRGSKAAKQEVAAVGRVNSLNLDGTASWGSSKTKVRLAVAGGQVNMVFGLTCNTSDT
jgi:hypothetical protein